MNINDIFNQTFINGFSSAPITMFSIMSCMLITIALATYIFFLYRFTTRKTFYNKHFNLTIFAISIIVAAIVLTIQSNLVISLSMAGVLSIIRFRTPVKDPLDLIFIFWGIAIGIICGVGYAQVAVILTICLTIGMLILEKLPIARAPKLLVVNGSSDMSVQDIMAVVTKFSKFNAIKSRNLRSDSSDMIIEVHTTDEILIVDEVNKCVGIMSVSLLSHDGEVTF